VPINVLLLGLALLVGLALVAFVWRRSHGILRDRVEEEAEEAREVLMPGANSEEVRGYGATNGNGNGNGHGSGSGSGRGSGTLSPTQEHRGRRL
jgi:hypothetical protein